MADKRKILITGGAGYLAGMLCEGLSDTFDLSLVDAVQRRDGDPRPDVVVRDLIDPDASSYESIFDGVDTVIHLAYKNPGGMFGNAIPPLERFPIEMQNIQMTFNVLNCAHRAGVRRVLIATSNAVTSWTEQNRIHTRLQDFVHPDDAPFSASFYGWAKLSYEQLAFLFANGDIGRKMDVVSMRIGAPRPVELADYGDDMNRYKRDLAAYISPRDWRQFVTRAIETEDITNADGVPFIVCYVVSENTRRFWSIENSMRVLGYTPEDDAEVIWAEDVRRALAGENPHPGRVGPGRAGGASTRGK
ncbi:MAG: NAD(P)-dependent oxidoreductase [Dehalococcoidia bacterium]|nr:NAD(P)-dependent oxidoreductase [Dehalococcoidia bacterium]